MYDHDTFIALLERNLELRRAAKRERTAEIEQSDAELLAALSPEESAKLDAFFKNATKIHTNEETGAVTYSLGGSVNYIKQPPNAGELGDEDKIRILLNRVVRLDPPSLRPGPIRAMMESELRPGTPWFRHRSVAVDEILAMGGKPVGEYGRLGDPNVGRVVVPLQLKSFEVGNQAKGRADARGRMAERAQKQIDYLRERLRSMQRGRYLAKHKGRRRGKRVAVPAEALLIKRYGSEQGYMRYLSNKIESLRPHVE